MTFISPTTALSAFCPSEETFTKTYPFLFYLKRNYPDAKFAIYYQDLIATHPHTDINWIKQHFDLVLSYDYNDAERYGILYYPTPYSSIPVETGIGTEKDLYFLGATKIALQRSSKLTKAARKMG